MENDTRPLYETMPPDNEEMAGNDSHQRSYPNHNFIVRAN